MTDSGIRVPVPALLRRVEIFRTLSEEERDAVASRMEVRRYRAGEALFKEGDPSDGLYVVHSGEVGIFTEVGGHGRILARLGPGECFGEMSLLTGEPRSTSVYATLDSELLFLKDAAFEALLRRYPTVALAIGRTLSLRLRKANRASSEDTRERIVFCVCATPAVDATGFARRISSALAAARGREILLICLRGNVPGSAPAPRAIAELKRSVRGGEGAGLDQFTSPLGDGVRLLSIQESSEGWNPRMLGQLLGLAVGQYAGVLVSADISGQGRASEPISKVPAMEEALRQSDAAILVVDTSDESVRCARGFVSRSTDNLPASSGDWRVALVRPEAIPPGTVEDLESRMGRQVTYHVVPGDEESLRRMARRLSHTAVGLALGGGGARGLVHIGIIEVLLDGGIPIDVIGGTSIGSILAALHVSGMDPRTMKETFLREWVHKNPLSDYTVPKTALIRGRRGERVLRRVLGEVRIEDLLKPYFAVAADLVSAEEVVLSRGPLWQAVRASGSIPVLITPVHVEGRFLVDGAVINNVPGDHLGRFGADVSIAVDVTPRREEYFERLLRPPRQRGFLGRLARRSSLLTEWLDYPNIIRTLRRVIDIEGLEIMKTKSAAFDVCIQPSVGGFDLLDFSKLERLVEAGREEASKALPTIRQRLKEVTREQRAAG